MNKYIYEKQKELNKVIKFFNKELTNIRTGRANLSLLNNIFVNSYGVKTNLNSLASLNIQDGQSIIIVPWDKNIIKDIEKAIVEANLGLGVTNEGEQIRVTVPKMNEENRKEIVKKVNDKMEGSRISFRQIRDEIKNDIENSAKEKDIDEDSKFKFIQELDEEIKKKNNELKKLRDKKEQEIMSI